MAFEAPSRNKAGRAGFIYAKVFGAFHPDLYLRDEPCLGGLPCAACCAAFMRVW